MNDSAAALAETARMELMDAGHRKVASFWHGPALSALDLACLMSFVACGFGVTVYSYEPLAGLPDALSIGDANEIVERKYLSAFRVLGKPSLSHFSDLFRYRLFQRTGQAWIDSDLLCLQDFEVPVRGNFFAKEVPDGINGAIMRIDPEDERLDRLVDLCLGYASGEEFVWGSTGPALVTKVFGAEALASAHPVERFYPIHWTDWWRPFLPSQREWCEEHCAESFTLHLWNNIVDKAGYWKDLAPPTGSFLEQQFSGYGLEGLFREKLPEGVMKQLSDNYAHSRNGAHLTVRELIGISVPRIGSAIKRRLWRPSADASQAK